MAKSFYYPIQLLSALFFFNYNIINKCKYTSACAWTVHLGLATEFKSLSSQLTQHVLARCGLAYIEDFH